MSLRRTGEDEMSVRSESSLARLARWKQMGGQTERDAQNLSAGRPTPPVEGWVPASQSVSEEFRWQGTARKEQPRPELSVTTEVLAEGSCERRLVLDGQLSATLSSWPIEGGTESMAVISDESSGVSEVVFRKLTVELSGQRSRSVTESGSASATMDLLARTAASYNTSTGTLLRTLGKVQSAESVLQQSLPADIRQPLN